MRVTVSKTGTYIPDWMGNDKLPKGEQIVMTYDCLTYHERQQCIYTKPITMKVGEDVENQSMEMEYVQDIPELIKLSKVRITNFEDQDGNKIDTGDKLLDTPDSCGLNGLIAGLGAHLINANRQENPKN